MRYLLLIYTDESVYEGMTDQQQAVEMKPWTDYTADLQNSGKMLSGEALMPANTATTVRAKAGGGAMTTDGPFAETKEALGGYYMINADNLDEAIAWAGKMPNLKQGGCVEIRPIVEFN